ncbi:hypothetical protein GCM10007854_07410 [Algimonas porphyrae]|uniref:MHYT domain-containing protein n=2 Tax=Algimonas porphyrae TaxID=1128113 RepID=A0ABQ5UX58_9PROT|nr:hypothetical protein GCM10007854_07410 [Algimonas porphyrae]
MAGLGLITIISAGSILFDDSLRSTQWNWTFIPGTIFMVIFGIVCCVTAIKQVREPALRWVLLSGALGVGISVIHYLTQMIFYWPTIDMPVVADFFAETMIEVTLIGCAAVIGILAIPLWSNYRRSH